MDKTAFNLWAGNENLSSETADRVWAVATSKLAFPSLNVVEAAMKFVIAETIDIKTMPMAGILQIDYGTSIVSNSFENDAALVDAAVKAALATDEFFRITGVQYNGGFISIEREGPIIKFARTDASGTFTFTLREVKNDDRNRW